MAFWPKSRSFQLARRGTRAVVDRPGEDATRRAPDLTRTGQVGLRATLYLYATKTGRIVFVSCHSI